jgi:hypothetical protein
MNKSTQYNGVVFAISQEVIRAEQAHIDNVRRLKESHQADADGENHN